MRRYFLSLILFMVSVLTVQAQVGIESARENGLSEQQAINQTLEDVTLTIDETYADSQQVVVWYTIEGLELPTGTIHGAPFIDPLILDEVGNFFNIGSSGGSVDFVEDGTIEGVYQMNMDLLPDTLNILTFQLRIYQADGMPLYIAPEGVPMTDAVSEEYAYELPYDLAFELPITVTPLAGITLVTDLVAESNDFTLSINEIALTPIQANIQVCFDLPNTRDWRPDMTLLINGDAEAQMLGYTLSALPTAEDTNRCATFDYSFAHAGVIETIEITVNGFVGFVPEIVDDATIQLAQERIIEQGIVGTYSIGERGINYQATAYPDDMTEIEANQAMYDALRERYDDVLWSFSIDVSDFDA